MVSVGRPGLFEVRGGWHLSFEVHFCEFWGHAIPERNTGKNGHTVLSIISYISRGEDHGESMDTRGYAMDIHG